MEKIKNNWKAIIFLLLGIILFSVSISGLLNFVENFEIVNNWNQSGIGQADYYTYLINLIIYSICLFFGIGNITLGIFLWK